MRLLFPSMRKVCGDTTYSYPAVRVFEDPHHEISANLTPFLPVSLHRSSGTLWALRVVPGGCTSANRCRTVPSSARSAQLDVMRRNAMSDQGADQGHQGRCKFLHADLAPFIDHLAWPCARAWRARYPAIFYDLTRRQRHDAQVFFWCRLERDRSSTPIVAARKLHRPSSHGRCH